MLLLLALPRDDDATGDGEEEDPPGLENPLPLLGETAALGALGLENPLLALGALGLENPLDPDEYEELGLENPPPELEKPRELLELLNCPASPLTGARTIARPTAAAAIVEMKRLY